jgi:hypothetical protein
LLFSLPIIGEPLSFALVHDRKAVLSQRQSSIAPRGRRCSQFRATLAPVVREGRRMRIRSPWIVAVQVAWSGLILSVALLIIDLWW